MQSPQYQAFRAGDVKDSQADIRRAKEILGYQPIVPFEEGLRRTVDWYPQHAFSRRALTSPIVRSRASQVDVSRWGRRATPGRHRACPPPNRSIRCRFHRQTSSR